MLHRLAGTFKVSYVKLGLLKLDITCLKPTFSAKPYTFDTCIYIKYHKCKI